MIKSYSTYSSIYHISLDPQRWANERESSKNARDEKENIYHGSPSTTKDLIFSSKEPQIKPDKQLQKMNNSTFQCTADITFGKQYLTDTHVVILVTTNVASLLGNIISKYLIYLLVNTRQLSNYSSKFPMLLSSLDVVTALTAQTLEKSILYLSNTHHVQSLF